MYAMVRATKTHNANARDKMMMMIKMSNLNLYVMCRALSHSLKPQNMAGSGKNVYIWLGIYICQNVNVRYCFNTLHYNVSCYDSLDFIFHFARSQFVNRVPLPSPHRSPHCKIVQLMEREEINCDRVFVCLALSMSSDFSKNRKRRNKSSMCLHHALQFARWKFLFIFVSIIHYTISVWLIGYACILNRYEAHAGRKMCAF